MVCGGCTGTVEDALSKLPGVTDVNVSLKTQTATVTTTDDSVACKCTKGPDGKCKCGDQCQCMQKSLVAALGEAGFNATVDGIANLCNCVCGVTCACGPNCTCTKKSTLYLQKASIGIAVFAIGWMASKKFYSK